MQATYTHDNLGRLTLAVFDNGTQISYSYDLVGNRTSVVKVGSLATTTGDPSQCELRASLTQNDPWGLADVTNGGILYLAPIFDGRVGIWNGSATYSFKSVPFSVNLTGLTAQSYRLYVYDSNDDAVVDAGELVAWVGNTPPSDTLVADGYLVKTGATNRRAVADIMLHATGQCDWRDARRGICHIDERSRRLARLTAFPSDNSWTVTRNTTSWRRVNAGATIGEHFIEFILSSTTLVRAEAMMFVTRAGGGAGNYKYQLGFGLDVTNADSANQPFGYDQNIDSATRCSTALSKFKANVAAGKRTLNLIEQNLSGRDVTAYGDNNDPTTFKSGMIVEIML